MPTFPVHYRPRPYQAPLHRMWQNKRVGIAVLPRQTGKDVSMSNEAISSRLRKPKTTGIYVSLDKPMIRDILWDKTYMCPECGEFVQSMQDNVPSELAEFKSTLMEIRFSNKSRMKLDGYFQSGRDKNGVGTSFQEYAFTELALFSREDPMPRLLPIIENESEPKRLMVASTPRGRRRNPLWQLIKAYENNPAAQVIIRTIDDINEIMRRAGLPPAVSQQRLEEIRDTYLRRFGNDRMFEQEYHVSFEEMDAAAVYGEAYMAMVADKRIHRFNLDPGHPVYVVFDIGSAGMHSDATSWIAFQWINNRHMVYDCGEGHGKALPDYVDVLRTKPYYRMIQAIILPWDGEHHEAAVSETPADMMRKKFEGRVAVLAKSRQVWKIPGSRQGDFTEITDIQATRMAMYNMVINADPPSDQAAEAQTESGLYVPGQYAERFCERLLECFENYKYEFNTKLQEWSERPLHDQFSHMMDTARYMVQSTKELDFFGGTWYDERSNSPTKSVDYEQDYTGVWR